MRNIPREIAGKYQGLFNLLNQEHDLILTISEMDEIILEAQKLVKNFSIAPVSGSYSICEGCGGDNVPWSAPSELWRKVTDNDKQSICPQCFIKKAEAKLNYKSVIVGFDAKVVNR